ncbi:MAG: PAS domain S-box protein, partial [Acidobacteriota bacterium]|nr:PAS domain S-box protein [Acidobacteriota bacterium]
MRLTRSKITLSLFGVSLLAGVVWFADTRASQTIPVIRVGVDHSPPYYLIDPDGSIHGLAVEVFNEAARRSHLKIEWKPLHDIPLENALDNGIVDMWPLVGTTPERSRKYFLSRPWLENEYVLASLREHPVRTPAEAAGKTVAHARLKFTGLIADQYLSKSRIDIRLYRADAVQALCSGEAQAVLIENHALDSILLARPEGCRDAGFQIATLKGATTPLSIAAVPRFEAEAKTIRNEIRAMSKDGFINAKLDEWSPFSTQGTRTIWAREDAGERGRIYGWVLSLFAVMIAVLGWVAWRAVSLKRLAEIAESKRRDIQRQFTAFMDHSPVAAFMKDAAGRTLYVNRAWTKLFGRRPEDVYGRKDFEIWPPETARQLRDVDEKLLASGKSVQVVESIPVATMEARDLLVVKFPFQNEQGESLIGGTAVDVTERERAMHDLEASEARYRILFEQNPLAVWVYDRETLRFLNVNAAAIRQYGWSREDFLSGMSAGDISADSDALRQLSSAEADRALAAEGPSRHLTREGAILSVDVTSYDLEYEHRPARLMIVRDLSEHERTLEQLRISEERWQLALNGAGDALWDWDIRADRVYRSPRWSAMLGYRDDEVGETREELLRLIHPEDVETMQSAVQVHLERKTVMFSAEYRLRHKDGRWRWILDRGRAVWDERGRPIRMAGSQTDITDRRAAEDLLTIQARTDALTGAANRREFERVAGDLFRHARLTGEPLTIAICDLDRFK